MSRFISNPELPETTVVDDCWSRIGSSGDSSCPLLAEVIHCRNCAVFARAARAFFERPLADQPPQQRAEAPSPLETAPAPETESGVVFRVGNALFAMETSALLEVTRPASIRRIPRRPDSALKGLVNIHGQIEVAISLADLFQIDPTATTPEPRRRKVYPRLMVTRWQGRKWVFPVDEVLGIQAFEKTAPETTDAARTRPRVESGFSEIVTPYLSDVYELDASPVGFLNAPTLFDGIEKRLLS
ncbi:Chemotaxis protein CheW [Sulfidibacter corallicola]|uniref:Chemotaxis protein CheW n=1 Tax=Sulfidibacter corallicola TaxID=2818388 RepID=A0A8A4TQ48_SULCO|nr:chemotaxis protein CheW [Sulfidibacter corallicola]QTD51108.1 chemotaxis protein CheW [Sulfidibacter corallicola]